MRQEPRPRRRQGEEFTSYRRAHAATFHDDAYIRNAAIAAVTARCRFLPSAWTPSYADIIAGKISPHARSHRRQRRQWRELDFHAAKKHAGAEKSTPPPRTDFAPLFIYRLTYTPFSNTRHSPRHQLRARLVDHHRDAVTMASYRPPPLPMRHVTHEHIVGHLIASAARTCLRDDGVAWTRCARTKPPPATAVKSILISYLNFTIIILRRSL